MLTVIDNHSVDLDRVGKGPVLDVGCRGFRFAEFFLKRGNRVVALDPDAGLAPPAGVEYMNVALVGSDVEMASLVLESDPEARHVVHFNEKPDKPTLLVKCTNLERLTSACRVDDWELVKINAEGSEFGILDRIERPLAKQIVVSFHEHTPARRGRDEVDALVRRLGKWYDVLRHEWDDRYCAGVNAWDTVLIRR